MVWRVKGVVFIGNGSIEQQVDPIHQYLVEAHLGQAYGQSRPISEFLRVRPSLFHQLLRRDNFGYQTDALSLRRTDHLAGHQVLFCLAHTYQQRPDDAATVTREYSHPDVRVADTGLLRSDHYVALQSDGSSQSSTGTIQSADNRLAARKQIDDDPLHTGAGNANGVIRIARYHEVNVAAR